MAEEKLKIKGQFVKIKVIGSPVDVLLQEDRSCLYEVRLCEPLDGVDEPVKSLIEMVNVGGQWRWKTLSSGGYVPTFSSLKDLLCCIVPSFVFPYQLNSYTLNATGDGTIGVRWEGTALDYNITNNLNSNDPFTLTDAFGTVIFQSRSLYDLLVEIIEEESRDNLPQPSECNLCQ